MFCKKALILTVLSLLMASTLTATTNPNSSTTIQKMNQMPLSFTKNMGQWDDRVLFRANAGGATMWFTKDGVTYQFTRRIETRSGAVPAPGLDSRLRGNDKESGNGIEKDSIEQLVLTAKFLGANPNPVVFADGQMEYKCNYFLGNDPTKWHKDVPNYEAITLKDIYPGIDLKYSGDGTGQAAYEFIAAPGVDIAQIKVAYEGAEETSLDADGRLILKTKWGDMIAAIDSPRPVGEGAGVRAVLSGNTSCAWRTSSSTTSSSDLAHGDVRQAMAGNSGTLTLAYSTYLGGGSYEYGWGIAVDGSDNAYVTGQTYSSNFPTQNPYQTDQDGWDVFVTKLSSSGSGLIYSTYLGGGGYDYGYDIAVDDSGNAYMTGWTSSTNFPTLNPYQTYHGAGDVFVTKLSSSGASLIYSTYLGGGSTDQGRAIAVDSGGYAYVTGNTYSTNFPTLNAYQATYQGGDKDAFVSKLSNSGNSLIYSTYLGGGGVDDGEDIAIDSGGYAYVTGYTYSTNFPTLNPFQSYRKSDYDAFVTKLSSSGASLIYSTYLGGEDSDGGCGITVDGGGYAYVTGGTSSSDFPISNPYQTYQGNGDVFVTKLSNSGNSLIFSTYLGGGSDDEGYGIAVDGGGYAYVTGYTDSPDFPALNPYQAYQGSYDVFVTKLSSSGNSLIYSTYLGGSGGDYVTGIAIDGGGNTYMTGYTYSTSFPTVNPYQEYQGSGDAFVTKLSWAPDYLCGDADGEGTINIADAVYLISYIFSHGSAPSPLAAGDADCDGVITIADVVYLIGYIFSHGPAPCAGCK